MNSDNTGYAPHTYRTYSIHAEGGEMPVVEPVEVAAPERYDPLTLFLWGFLVGGVVNGITVIIVYHLAIG